MNLAALKSRTSHRPLLLRVAAVLVPAVLFAGTPALAGPLVSDLGISYTGAWAGSTPFATGTLSGYIDWAVYGPGGFPYAAGGYTPTPGQFTYAYQIFVTGSAPVSHFDVDLSQKPANNIGSFTTFGAVAPSATSLDVGNTLAAFDFLAPPVSSGSSSIGLAFSSVRNPQDWFGSLIDTGQSTFVVPIPGPADILIGPEPASCVLLGMGAALLVPRAIRRWRRQ
ncbi:MAG: hypothetical protein WD845_04925 [Pirellulales bacterium]